MDEMATANSYVCMYVCELLQPKVIQILILDPNRQICYGPKFDWPKFWSDGPEQNSKFELLQIYKAKFWALTWLIGPESYSPDPQESRLVELVVDPQEARRCFIDQVHRTISFRVGCLNPNPVESESDPLISSFDPFPLRENKTLIQFFPKQNLLPFLRC